jgi:hypothetical protein
MLRFLLKKTSDFDKFISYPVASSYILRMLIKCLTSSIVDLQKQEAIINKKEVGHHRCPSADLYSM